MFFYSCTRVTMMALVGVLVALSIYGFICCLSFRSLEIDL